MVKVLELRSKFVNILVFLVKFVKNLIFGFLNQEFSVFGFKKCQKFGFLTKMVWFCGGLVVFKTKIFSF